jgi:hypothetical protein
MRVPHVRIESYVRLSTGQALAGIAEVPTPLVRGNTAAQEGIETSRTPSGVADALSGQEALIFCLGAYTETVPDSELRTITVGYTIRVRARVLRSSSPGAAFSFRAGMAQTRPDEVRFPSRADVAFRRTGERGGFVSENRGIRAVVESPHPKRE